MTKSLEAPAKPSFEELQRKKLIEAWTFKSMREAELKGFQEKSASLQEEFKQLQAKTTEVVTQKRDADVVIQTIAQILTELGVNPQQVLEEAFAQPAPQAEPQTEEIVAVEEAVVDAGNEVEEAPSPRKR